MAETVKESVQNSFNKLEKNNVDLFNGNDLSLKNVDHSDFMKSLEWMGNQKFNIKGVDTKLSTIVMGLETTTGKAKYKNEEIKWGSDLGAAIQAYLIARGTYTGGIDGKLGNVSIAAIERAKNRELAENNRAAEPQKETIPPLESVDEILSKNLYKYFGKPGVKDNYTYTPENYRDTFKILDSATGKLKGQLIDNKATLAFTYQSSQDGAIHIMKIQTSEFKNSDLTVNTEKLVDSIKKRIRNNEVKLRNEKREKRVKDGIDGYTERSIANAVVKKYFVDKNVDFRYVKTITKTDGYKYAVIKNKNGNNTRIEREIRYDNILDKNSNYVPGKYAGALVKIYENNAISYVRGELNKAKVTAGGFSDLDRKIAGFEGIIKAIDGCGDKYKNTFKAEKQEAGKQIDYRESVKKVNTAIENINKSTDYNERLKRLKSIVVIDEKPNSNVLVVDYNGLTRAKYAAVGKKNEYMTKVTPLVNNVLHHGYEEINK